MPRERAILSAVIGLLAESGYEAMTMDAVAARAHASKTTIYLGYALCTVIVELPGGIRRASWDATVWQRDPSGDWRIAVDISTPLPC